MEHAHAAPSPMVKPREACPPKKAMPKKKRILGKATRTIAKVVTGIGAIAEIAGAYFSDPRGLKRRTTIKSWGLKMQGEILEEIERLKNLGERQYREIIDATALRYRALKHVDPKELQEIVRELKGHWRNIRRDVSRAIANEQRKQKAKPRSSSNL